MTGALLAIGSGLILAQAPAVSAYPTSTITISGHGWGHGIGMGQYGALGYAIGQDNGDGNETYQWILGHFYAPATLTTLPTAQDAAQTVRIVLTENNGNDVIATAPGGVTVPGTATTAPAVLLSPNSDNATYAVQTGPGCAGPWTTVAASVAAPTVRDVANGGEVQLCQAGGNLNVHGTLQGTYNTGTPPVPRTVNTLPLEEYVADTTPGESSTGWANLGGSVNAPQGQNWGFQELEAQAVAVRSYVMSNLGGYGGYADSCDQTCQSYHGTQFENLISIAAAVDTTGEVMSMPNGSVANTEYSSSSGGYSTGGAFNIVPDDGDAVCVTGACNPNHSWTTQVSVASIQADWPQLGTLESISITSRNGDGDFGGRVNTLNLVGSAATVSATGPEFADDLGLKSDWFNIGGSSSTGAPSGGESGYWLTAADGSVYDFGAAPNLGSMAGQALVKPVVGMAPTSDGKGYYEVATDGGIFTFGDAHFYGSMGGKHLNQPVVGIAPTADGGGYWEVAADGGMFSFGDAHFYGSMGGLHLNKPIVGMTPTADGGGYWLVASDGGIFAFGDAHFYGSTGNLTLVQPIVGMTVEPNGSGYWMVAADGGVFAFGSAPYEGTTAGSPAGVGTSAIAATKTGNGYIEVTSHGQVASFGDAPGFGDETTASPPFGGQMVGAAFSSS